jgi:phosphopantetheinyl transferase
MIPDGLIGVWQLTESSIELLPNFTIEELADSVFLKYTHEKRKVEWLATRVLIKKLIGFDFSITYSNSGKPIIDHAIYKHLSISHSRDFVAIILHQHLNVGIDIENITRNYNPIEQRYLSEVELLQVNKTPRNQCIYWCAKEAIFKLVPEDGVEFRQQIQISPFNPEVDNEFSARFLGEYRVLDYRLHFQTFSEHCLIWVTNEPEELS